MLEELKNAVVYKARIVYAKVSNLHEDASIEERATMFGKSLNATPDMQSYPR